MHCMRKVHVLIIRASPALPIIPLSQALDRKPKKPRNSENGDPVWRMVDSPVALGGTLGTKLSGHGELVGEKVKAMQIASEAGFGESIIQSNQGGGGWSLCCVAAGEMSTVTRDITWTYRCKAHSSYGCPAKLRIIYRQVTDTMCVLTSTGWNHVHSGLIQT